LGDHDLEKPGKNQDFENDLEANASAFEALERDFQDVRYKKAMSIDFLV
jgi:hypothetical protein